MFDARRRYIINKDSKEVVYIKDMHAKVLDKPISVGRPLTDQELVKYDVTYRWDTQMLKSRTEILSVINRIAKGRFLGGYRPSMLDGF